MARLSNIGIGFVNTLTFIASLGTIALSIYFNYHTNTTACQKVLQQPLLILGLSLLAVSFLGLVGSCCRVRSLLWIYLLVVFLLIFGLIFFTGFVFVVTNKGAGEAVSGRGYKESRLGDYSNWLQKYVVNEKHWGKIRSCLVDAKVCSSVGGQPGETVDDFNRRKLSPTQFGCCKPPTNCGFEFKNGTFWTIPKTGPAAPADSDCKTWSNDERALCYDCKSCKAGVLVNIKKEWRVLCIINVVVIVFVIIIFSLGCHALWNNQSSGCHRYNGFP